MVRNGKCIHHGAVNTEPDAHVDLDGRPLDPSKIIMSNVKVFHYGHARSKESYIKKMNHIEGRHSGWKWKPVTIDNFEWLPDNKLTSFRGTHPATMEARIKLGGDHKEIMELYNYCGGEADADKSI